MVYTFVPRLVTVAFAGTFALRLRYVTFTRYVYVLRLFQLFDFAFTGCLRAFDCFALLLRCVAFSRCIYVTRVPQIPLIGLLLRLDCALFDSLHVLIILHVLVLRLVGLRSCVHVGLLVY